MEPSERLKQHSTGQDGHSEGVDWIVYLYSVSYDGWIQKSKLDWNMSTASMALYSVRE